MPASSKEKPILFSGGMIRAILENRKVQTRRVMKSWGVDRAEVIRKYSNSNGHTGCWSLLRYDDAEARQRDVACKRHPIDVIRCPCGVPGDRLWVRETWTGTWCYEEMHLSYAADGSERYAPEAPHDYCLPKAAIKPASWVTPLFMPRWASRINLEITDVRVQRAQEISAADAVAEGCESCTPYDQYRALWDSINGKRDGGAYAWAANPFVWALTFRRVQ